MSNGEKSVLLGILEAMPNPEHCWGCGEWQTECDDDDCYYQVIPKLRDEAIALLKSREL